MTKDRLKDVEVLLGTPIQNEEKISEDHDAILLRIENEEYLSQKQDREQRKIFGYCIFAFMCVYMIIAISIVFMCGWGKMQLSDMVIITLIGSTLIEVIGIFNFVVRYLFHKRF